MTVLADCRDYGEGCVLTMVQLLDERGNVLHGPARLPVRPPQLSARVPRLRLAVLSAGSARPCGSRGSSHAGHRWGSSAAVYGIARGARLGIARRLAAALAGVALCPWFVQTWAPPRARGHAGHLLLGGRPSTPSCAGLPPGSCSRSSGSAFFTKQNALLAPPPSCSRCLAVRAAATASRGAAAGFALPLAAPVRPPGGWRPAARPTATS